MLSRLERRFLVLVESIHSITYHGKTLSKPAFFSIFAHFPLLLDIILEQSQSAFVSVSFSLTPVPLDATAASTLVPHRRKCSVDHSRSHPRDRLVLTLHLACRDTSHYHAIRLYRSLRGSLHVHHAHESREVSSYFLHNPSITSNVLVDTVLF